MKEEINNILIQNLLEIFRKEQIQIDDITITKNGNTKSYVDEYDTIYYVNFWYNATLVTYSYKMKYQNIEHYLKGIIQAYTYDFKSH